MKTDCDFKYGFYYTKKRNKIQSFFIKFTIYLKRQAECCDTCTKTWEVIMQLFGNASEME